jgi:hypothetical protein
MLHMIHYLHKILNFPLKWRAAVREQSAELTFCVGGTFG